MAVLLFKAAVVQMPAQPLELPELRLSAGNVDGVGKTAQQELFLRSARPRENPAQIELSLSHRRGNGNGTLLLEGVEFIVSWLDIPPDLGPSIEPVVHPKPSIFMVSASSGPGWCSSALSASCQGGSIPNMSYTSTSTALRVAKSSVRVS